MKVKIEHVNDDWERLYINGDLIHENHSIPIFVLLCAMMKYDKSIEFEETEVEEEE